MLAAYAAQVIETTSNWSWMLINTSLSLGITLMKGWLLLTRGYFTLHYIINYL